MVLQRFFDEDDESDDAGKGEELGEEQQEAGSDESEEDDNDDDSDDGGEADAPSESKAVELGQTQEDTSKNSLSKRSRKKLEKYAEDKTKRRAGEKERRKRRAAERRDLQEKNPDAEIEGFGHKKRRLKQNKMENSQCKLRVAVDCSFDELMEDRDISKLCKQIQSAYTMNRRLVNPLQLYVTGLDGESRVKKMFDEVYQGSANWDIHRKSEHVKTVFPSEEIVYLTSDSDNVLEKVEDGKVYIIGGLSDQNRHEGHCYRTASVAGLAHARLPIDEHVESPPCHVLTVSRAFGALANVTHNGRDWKKALESIMPKKREEAKGEECGQKQNPDGGGGGGGNKKKKRTKRGGKKHRKNATVGTAKETDVGAAP